MTPGPWLPTTSRAATLEADLRARGWRTFWHRDPRSRVVGLTVTAPDGKRINGDGNTDERRMQDAYAQAMEYANEATRQAVELAYEHGRGLDGLKGRL